MMHRDVLKSADKKCNGEADGLKRKTPKDGHLHMMPHLRKLRFPTHTDPPRWVGFQKGSRRVVKSIPSLREGFFDVFKAVVI